MSTPTMLYKSGGKHKIHGGKFDYIIVDAETDELKEALSDGWFKTTEEAAKSGGGLESKTREELEDIAEAMEADNEGLNIAFNSRTDDDTLRQRIMDAKAQLEA